ncbi:MAG: type II toxin-antitoxin system RelE/ParE family toxin [Candidatus Rokubacteria bacterium]|nr:type II toxin-antitoxin system RelE/ParE family toxin [Candidatus Rokubacteria bacterium]
MTYRLVVRRQAKADIREAARWYERQRVGLGLAFVQQVDALLDRVRLNPMQYQIVHREVRRAIPRRFPYGVFYRIDGSEILVFAVVDLHRDPSIWQDREMSREGEQQA